jgi:hypothetical protein
MLDVVLDVRWMDVGCTLDDVGCELQIMLDVVLDVCWMCVGWLLEGRRTSRPTLWERPGFKPRRRHFGSDRGSSPGAVSNPSEAAHSRMNTMQHTLYHLLTSKLVHMYLHLDFNGR